MNCQIICLIFFFFWGGGGGLASDIKKIISQFIFWENIVFVCEKSLLKNDLSNIFFYIFFWGGEGGQGVPNFFAPKKKMVQNSTSSIFGNS